MPLLLRQPRPANPLLDTLTNVLDHPAQLVLERHRKAAASHFLSPHFHAVDQALESDLAPLLRNLVDIQVEQGGCARTAGLIDRNAARLRIA